MQIVVNYARIHAPHYSCIRTNLTRISLRKLTEITCLKQPVISSGNNILVLQESSINRLGAIVAYAPVDITSLDMAVNGRDSSNVPLVPSGFIISSDGHPGNTAGACSSTTTNPEGSLLTIVFQIQDCDASSPKHVSMEMVASVHALIKSTVRSIKSALNCTSLD